MLQITEAIVQDYIKTTFGEESSCGEVEVLQTLDVNDIEMVYNHGCSVGVTGFIYYSETEEFFNRHQSEVFDEFNQFIDELGYDCVNFEINANNLTWLFVEQVVYRFISWAEAELL